MRFSALTAWHEVHVNEISCTYSMTGIHINEISCTYSMTGIHVNEVSCTYSMTGIHVNEIFCTYSMTGWDFLCLYCRVPPPSPRAPMYGGVRTCVEGPLARGTCTGGWNPIHSHGLTAPDPSPISIYKRYSGPLQYIQSNDCRILLPNWQPLLPFLLATPSCLCPPAIPTWGSTFMLACNNKHYPEGNALIQYRMQHEMELPVPYWPILTN